jgi:sporulation integral membrane protein YlbJ
MKKFWDLIIPVCIAMLAAGLLMRSSAVSQGVREGLAASAGTLIPALFPFMVLCRFLARTGYGAALARPFRVLWQYIFRIPGEAGAVALLSLIGGYPVGAKGVSELLRRGVVDKATAGRMLCFCVNCGPSFLITAAGASMLSDRAAGVILFATQTLATLTIGAAFSLRAPMPERKPKVKVTEKAGIALVAAVTGASLSMITVCAFAVLFAGLLALLNTSGFPAWLAAGTGLADGMVAAILGGLFEVVSGSAASARLGGETAILFMSLCASFGGLSVIFQIISCFDGQEVSFRRFILARLIHMPLAAAMAVPLWSHFRQGAAVTAFALAQRQPPIAQAGPSVWLSSTCLIGMCTILIFSTCSLRKREIRGKIEGENQGRQKSWKSK